jgi:hypothetical protein
MLTNREVAILATRRHRRTGCSLADAEGWALRHFSTYEGRRRLLGYWNALVRRARARGTTTRNVALRRA